MQKFECLESIVGVTKDFCQCLHGQIDETEFQEVNKSNSGLFLDNVEGGLFLRNVPQLDKCKSFFDIQVEAIKNAKNFFSADILAELYLKYQVKKTNYFGEIGKIRAALALAHDPKPRGQQAFDGVFQADHMDRAGLQDGGGQGGQGGGFARARGPHHQHQPFGQFG